MSKGTSKGLQHHQTICPHTAMSKEEKEGARTSAMFNKEEILPRSSLPPDFPLHFRGQTGSDGHTNQFLAKGNEYTLTALTRL